MRFGGFYTVETDDEGNMTERRLPDDLYEEYGEGKGKRVLDLDYLKYLNFCISFDGLAAVDAERGRDWLCRESGLSRHIVQEMVGRKADGSVAECSLPKPSNVAKICGALGCRLSDIMEFNGYEVLDRYTVPPLRDYSLGRLTYEPLRGMFYDMYGYRDWQDELKRLVTFLEPHDRARKRDDKFASIDEGKRVDNWRNKVRLHLLKDKDIDLRTLYDICAVLNCPVGCVMGHK